MTIITRSALVSWGAIFGKTHDLPPDLAYITSAGVGGERRVVTWAEVLEIRRKRQAERLRLIHHVSERRAYRIWVAYFDQWCMGGWQAFIDRGQKQYGEWIDRDRSWLKPVIMQMFPLVLPMGSERDQWNHWKQTFASQHERRRQDGHPVGVVYVWWDGHTMPRPIESRPSLALKERAE